METGTLEKKIAKLPDNLKQKAEKFIDALLYEAKSLATNPDDKQSKLKREFGGMRGLVTYMADDFDEPLDDFKDYM